MARVKLAAGFILTALIALWYLAAPGALAQQSSPQILVADVDGPVTPVMLSFIERAIAEADARNAEALILRLDTPGGEVSMTKRIIQTMIASSSLRLSVFVRLRKRFFTSCWLTEEPPYA